MVQDDTPEGFKNTDAGIIPEEWAPVDLRDFCTLQRGFDITESERKAGTIPVYSSSGISYFHSKAMVNPPGVVTGRKGQLGKVFFISEPFWPHDTTLWVKKFNGNFPQFVALVLSHFHLERFNGSTSVPTLNRNTLFGNFVACPPIPEQRAIATALSAIDSLIVGLDSLIAKKRALKQAAMQQLLTGQKRIPGFLEEWKSFRLGDHVSFLRNGVNSRAELQIEGKVKYLHYGDIHSSSSVMMSPNLLPSIPEFKAGNLDRLCNGDLVFADASEDLDGIGKSVEIRNVENHTSLVAGLHTIAARFDKSVLADGYKAYLQFCPTFINHLRRYAAGTKVYASTRAHVASIEMKLPLVDEQQAITAILIDLESELLALEKRREKTRLLKQGMMQQLLTGRIRLVHPAERHEPKPRPQIVP